MDKDNYEVLTVYLRVRNQVVTAGMGEIIDIDFNALRFVMELYEVRDKRTCFERVLGVFHHILRESNFSKNVAKNITRGTTHG